MEVRYNKTTTNETDDGKEVKLHFSGSAEGIKLNFTINGSKDLIQVFMQDNGLTHYGQTIDLTVENKQQRLWGKRKMKIKTKVLSEYLKKVFLNSSVKEFLADFNEQGLTVTVNNMQNTAMIKADLKKESFVEYEALGKVAFMNLDKLITLISGFGSEELEVTIEGNLLVFKAGNRKVETEVANIESITPIEFKTEKFQGMTPVKFSAGFFNDLVGDLSINKNYFFKLRTEEGKLIIQSTGDFRFTEIIEVPELKDNVKVDFGSPLIDAFKALNGTVILNLKDNYPAYIVEDSENGKVQILVAPRVTSE